MIRASLPRFEGSKGISNVIATIFLVLVVFVISSNIFLYTMAQNTRYNQAVKESHQMDADRFSERVVTSHGNFTVLPPDTVLVDVTISNQGPVATQVITIWVVCKDEDFERYGYEKLDINLDPGDSVSREISVTVPGAQSAGTFSGWLVTARGNLVSLEKEKIVVVAQVSEGIGSIQMDFNNFKYYYWNSKNNSITPWPEGIKNFTIPSSLPLVFGIVLSNWDKLHRDITFYESSMLWAYFEKAPGQRATWYIKVVSNGTIVPYSPVTLEYGQSRWIYFGPETPLRSGVGAFNLVLLGTIDDQSYGQNIPFVSVNFL